MKKMAVLALVLACVATPAGAYTKPDFIQRVLAIHNAVRATLHLPPLVWSEKLAADSLPWANHLERIGDLVHAKDAVADTEGENLWMGTEGNWTLEEMIQDWADERKLYRYGVFPKGSTTGNWEDIGHYTQMVWRDTTQVGCALVTGGGNDYLVCRYSPPGNYEGEKPY
ncbi:MAG TPA: CAP domain-containing protein [Rhizomicrobium sp.]